MGSPARKIEQKWTYADYLTWDDDQRWELIDGAAYAMTPGPTFLHQNIARKLISRLDRHFTGRSCTPFIAHFDVVLDDTNVVQPDVFVVCDRDRIMNANITGAPDLIFEILSPSSMVRKRWRFTRGLVCGNTSSSIQWMKSWNDIYWLTGATVRRRSLTGRKFSLLASFPT